MAALAVNTLVVNMATRGAVPRDNGRLIATDVVQANVRVEGEGFAVVLIHRFSPALDWWEEIAPSLARTHRVIRLDLIGHGGTAAARSGYEITRQAALVEACPRRIDRVILIDMPASGDVAFGWPHPSTSRARWPCQPK